MQTIYLLVLYYCFKVYLLFCLPINRNNNYVLVVVWLVELVSESQRRGEWLQISSPISVLPDFGNFVRRSRRWAKYRHCDTKHTGRFSIGENRPDPWQLNNREEQTANTKRNFLCALICTRRMTANFIADISHAKFRLFSYYSTKLTGQFSIGEDRPVCFWLISIVGTFTSE